MSKPEFSMVTCLRGYTNFEDTYQGQSTATPLWLSDRPTGKDPDAENAYAELQAQYVQQGSTFTPALTRNQNGISPFLQRGMPVPMGAYVLLYLPYVNASNGGSLLQYHVGWRIRSASTFQTSNTLFHSRNDAAGQSDDGSVNVNPGATTKFAGAATVRKLIVAAMEMERFAQAEPAASSALYATQDMWPLALVASSTGTFLPGPLFPGIAPATTAAGDVQQGYVINGLGGANRAVYVPHLLRAKGDELLLAVSPVTASTYDFDNAHYILSLLFGRAGYVTGQPTIATPLSPVTGLGVYMSTGVGP